MQYLGGFIIQRSEEATRKTRGWGAFTFWQSSTVVVEGMWSIGFLSREWHLVTEGWIWIHNRLDALEILNQTVPFLSFCWFNTDSRSIYHKSRSTEGKIRVLRVDIERIHLYYLYSTYWIHGSATGRVEGTTPIGRKERIYITSLVKAYVSHT